MRRRVGWQLSRVVTRDAIIVCKGTSLKRNCTKVVSVQKVVRPPCVRRRRGNRPWRKKKCLASSNVQRGISSCATGNISDLITTRRRNACHLMHILIVTTETEYLISILTHYIIANLTMQPYKLLFSTFNHVDLHFLVTIKLYFWIYRIYVNCTYIALVINYHIFYFTNVTFQKLY